MADAFRGLTIRLGADARPLNSAINSITKSAGQAQRQMNMLGKALKFNPANVQALGRMVDLAGDKALHSARQVQTLETAIKQASAESKKLFAGTKFEGQDIEKLANGTREAYAATQRLRSEQGHVNAALVGAVGHHIAIACLAQGAAARKVAQDRVVLHLGQPHQHGPVALGIGHGGQRARQGIQLPPIAPRRPSAFGIGQELLVVLQRVVAAVEEVLDVPEHTGPSRRLTLAEKRQKEE